MPKNRFSRHISSIFGRKKSFYKVGLRHFVGIAILHLCAKNQQKIMSQSREKQEIGKWSKGFSLKTKIRNLRRKNIFREKFFRPYLRVLCTLFFCKKSEKTNEANLHKVQKNPNLPKKTLFRKSGSVTFWALPLCTFVPKFRKN